MGINPRLLDKDCLPYSIRASVADEATLDVDCPIAGRVDGDLYRVGGELLEWRGGALQPFISAINGGMIAPNGVTSEINVNRFEVAVDPNTLALGVSTQPRSAYQFTASGTGILDMVLIWYSPPGDPNWYRHDQKSQSIVGVPQPFVPVPSGGGFWTLLPINAATSNDGMIPAGGVIPINTNGDYDLQVCVSTQNDYPAVGNDFLDVQIRINGANSPEWDRRKVAARLFGFVNSMVSTWNLPDLTGSVDSVGVYVRQFTGVPVDMRVSTLKMWRN